VPLSCRWRDDYTIGCPELPQFADMGDSHAIGPGPDIGLPNGLFLEAGCPY
jgi:hypothetical protein